MYVGNETTCGDATPCIRVSKGECWCRGVNPHVEPSMAAGSVAAPRQASGHPAIFNERRIVAGISSFAFQVGGCYVLQLTCIPLEPCLCLGRCCFVTAVLLNASELLRCCHCVFPQQENHWQTSTSVLVNN